MINLSPSNVIVITDSHTHSNTYEQHTYIITCAPKGGTTFVSSKAQDQEIEKQDQVYRSFTVHPKVHTMPLWYGRT